MFIFAIRKLAYRLRAVNSGKITHVATPVQKFANLCYICASGDCTEKCKYFKERYVPNGCRKFLLYDAAKLIEAFNESMIAIDRRIIDNAKKGEKMQMANNCKFILTYIYCNWEVNGAIGVFNNHNEVMGKIIDMTLGMWDASDPAVRGTDPEFNFKFVHDDANDLYYDVEIHFPFKEADDIDIYRVYYLREEKEDGND